MTKLFAKILPAVILFSLLITSAYGQQIQGETATGAPGITISVADLQKLSDTKPIGTGLRIFEELETRRFRIPKTNPDAPRISSYPESKAETIPVANNITQTIHSNFQGTDFGESGGITPPDNMGEVGPTQLCVVSNGRIKFYTKPTVCQPALTTSTSNGTSSLGNPIFSSDLDVFFSTVRNGQSSTDPHIHYDRLSQRWFIVAINVANNSNRIMIAVSSGPTITDATNFTFFAFAHDQGAATSSNDRGAFCDYPMLGVDKNALYIGGVIFNEAKSYFGSSCYVVNKAQLIGGSLQFTAFRGLGVFNTGTGAGNGIFVPQGVNNYSPNPEFGFFIGPDMILVSKIRYVVITNPGSASPTATQFQLNVPATALPIDQPAGGSAFPVDGGGDDRLLNAQIVTNKLDGRVSLYTAHAIGVRSDGIADETTPDRNAERWYEFSVVGSTLSLRQSGTLFDNAGSGQKGYFMGSIMGSGQGHAVLGASVASTSLPINAIISGRYNNQTLGQLSPEVNATSFSESYNLQAETPQRWGDYSQTVVDPNDDMTLWTFQQYTNGNNSWAVRAVQLKAPPPATPTNMTAITCTSNRTQNVTLTGQSANFSGFFDPGADANGPGYLNRLQVSSSGGVTISNVVFNSPTQISFNVNYAAAALGSQQTITVANPDCQTVTLNYTLPTGCVALPVKWLGISANWVGTQAKVEWKVAEEKNTLAYELERSLDGKNFASLNRVSSHNQSGTSGYDYTDLQPGLENYYRIKQIDKDGTIAYSSIVLLSKKTVTKLTVSPNPAKDEIRVLLPSNSGQVRLLDGSGKLIGSKTVTTNLVSFAVENLSRGMYLVEFINNNKTERARVVLQ